MTAKINWFFPGSVKALIQLTIANVVNIIISTIINTA